MMMETIESAREVKKLKIKNSPTLLETPANGSTDADMSTDDALQNNSEDIRSVQSDSHRDGLRQACQTKN